MTPQKGRCITFLQKIEEHWNKKKYCEQMKWLMCNNNTRNIQILTSLDIKQNFETSFIVIDATIDVMHLPQDRRQFYNFIDTKVAGSQGIVPCGSIDLVGKANVVMNFTSLFQIAGPGLETPN
jgi:hypothetical protein